uniref:Adhesion G protein-coupled receptor A2 n=1 Tax=Strix occidentalis caurina TaxID=311401 RepID=A0A8D0FAE9_STROC
HLPPRQRRGASRLPCALWRANEREMGRKAANEALAGGSAALGAAEEPAPGRWGLAGDRDALVPPPHCVNGNNLISTVQPGAFLGLPELKRLDLSNNRIGCLSASVFQGLPNLLRLNMSGNIFSSLPPGVFDELPSLKVVDFATEYLTCDCNLRWVLPWARNRSAQISERTACVYPRHLQAFPLRTGAPELHTHHLIPSLRQVVFQGDRLPFQCTATYLDNSTQIRWFHNREPVEEDERTGVIVEESLIHDCTFITSELILSNIHVSANGEWECAVSTSQGNVSKKVEIVVLETSASYCPAERVTNNRGDFRWPRTLAGITAYQPCLQYPFAAGPAGSGSAAEKQAWRRCDRAGRWEEGDYSHCLYTNDITRVLYTFVLMPINASNALTLAHQLRVYTAEAANFSDMVDVLYVAQMIEKFIGYVDQIKQLTDVIVEMASNIMLVDDHILWMSQKEEKACTSIVRSLEKIAAHTLGSNSQHMANSRNIAFEAYVVKPESYVGLSCVAFQRREGGPAGRPPPAERGTEPLPDQQLRLRCTTGRPNVSLTSFHIKNSIALASIQLPPSLFASPAPATPLADCKLQLLVFRNGKLFCSTGNSSRLADDGKRRSVATPVIYAGTCKDGCGVGNLSEPVAVSLRHPGEGADPVAAYWNFEVLGGMGGWSAEGCQLAAREPNVTSLHCRHLSNVAVLMVGGVEARGAAEVLHPAMYTCTAVLLLCLFTTIITYIVNHGTILIPRKGWHMLLNLCFHIAMTAAVFAGGITLTGYLIVCQAVGIILHYSSLSTLLWMAVKARVLYKELTWKAPRQPDGDTSQPAPRPMLRFYLIAGGIPLIICGITAAVNIHNYHDNNPYCWLVWRPSLGAFYVPVAFILLVTWIYFLCAGLSLQCRPSRRKDVPEPPEPPPPRLGGTGDLLTDSGSISVTLNSGPPCPEADGVHSLQVQFWALVTTHALYVALWTFGAMAVSQRWYLNIVFSCLYGITAVVLGLFIFIHHCLRRRDVLNSWFSCCPSYRNALPMQAYVHPGLVPEDGSQVFIGCDPEAAHSGASSSSSPSSAGSAGGRCKLTNLQVAQSQADARPAACPEPDPGDSKPGGAGRHASNLHGRRNHRGRTKQCRDGKHHRLKMLRGPSSEHPSSESGSLHNSHSESYHSGRNSPISSGRAVPRAPHDGEMVPSHSEGSDGSRRAPDFAEARRRSASRDNLRQAGAAEKEAKRRSYPLNVASHNGGLKGSKYDINLASADSVAGMKTGLWKSETTV